MWMLLNWIRMLASILLFICFSPSLILIGFLKVLKPPIFAWLCMCRWIEYEVIRFHICMYGIIEIGMASWYKIQRKLSCVDRYMHIVEHKTVKTPWSLDTPDSVIIKCIMGLRVENNNCFGYKIVWQFTGELTLTVKWSLRSQIDVFPGKEITAVTQILRLTFMLVVLCTPMFMIAYALLQKRLYICSLSGSLAFLWGR